MVTSTYGLKKQVSGWRLYDYLESELKLLFLNSDPSIWTDPIKFKTYFYQNLFRFLYNYKLAFTINEIEDITNLENMIINTMYNFLKENQLAEIN